MEFGSEAVFQYIKNGISSGDELFYTRIFRVVEADAKSLLTAFRFQRDDQDEIIQLIEIAVSRDLDDFVSDPRSCYEEKRNSWLKTVVYNACRSFFRYQYRSREDPSTGVFLFDQVATEDRWSDPEKIICSEDEHLELMRRIQKVFEINTTPQKIIAYLFSKIIGSLFLSRANGAPKQVVEMLYGKTVCEASQMLKNCLSAIVLRPIPKEVYTEFDRKVLWVMENGTAEEKIFCLTPRQIAESSNWMLSKMKKNIEE